MSVELSAAAVTSRHELAAALTRFREASGLTVREVAARAGLPSATAGDYFAGRHLPPLASMAQFERVLEVIGVPPEQRAAWLDAVTRLRRRSGRRPAQSASPYRGLTSYQPEDADLFFGREALTERLVRIVTDGCAQPLVVIGPSGSGKSSLLRAGLAARLVHDGRKVTVTTPTSLDGVASDVGEGSVLVVDQVEEALSGSADVVSPAELMAAVAGAGDRGATVVLGLRADFFDRALAVDPLARWLTDNQLVVGPLGASELRRVVVEPARALGIEVEEALVDVLLAEATAGSARREVLDPGALPLVSHALYATWLVSASRRLTVAHYREVGSFGDAVARTADDVYESLPEGQRAIARATLLRLVHVRQGAADTRRPADRREFTQPAELEVIDAFVEARLLTSDQTHVQLAHEALLTAWPRLRNWLETDREGLHTRARLTDAAAEWVASGADPDLLYRGSALERVETWLAETSEPAALTAPELAFLTAARESTAAAARRRRRATTRLRVLAVGLAVATVASCAFGATAVAQSSARARERDLAISRQLAVTADSLALSDPALAGQVAVAAESRADTVEARSALLSASGHTSQARLAVTDSVINVIETSPDGQYLAVGTGQGGVSLWSTTAAARRLATLAATGATYAVAFSPDGTRLFAGGDDGTVQEWDVTDPAHPSVVQIDGATVGGTIYGLAVDRTGTMVAAGVSDGTVHVWTRTGSASFASTVTLPELGGTVQAVAIHGSTLVAGGSAGRLAIWDVADPSAPVELGSPLTVAAAQLNSLALSPDGRTLAAGSADASVHLVDLSDPAAPSSTGQLAGPTTWVNQLCFSPDGATLAAASSDKHIWTWDVASRAATGSLPTPTTQIAVAWAPDGSSVYSGGASGSLRAWPVPGPILGGFSSIPGQAVFGDGVLVTATTDGLRVWDDSDPQNPRPVSLSPAPPGARLNGAVAVSDRLHLAAAGDTAGSVHVWDIRRPAAPVLLGTLSGHTSGVETISFDPGGTRLALSSDDASISLWDLSAGLPPSPIATLKDLGGPVYTVFFSPDATTLVASVLSGQVLLVDVTDFGHPKLIGHPITGPRGYVYSSAFSPDGRTIAASGNDGTIWLWDVHDPAAPRTLGAPLVWAEGYATNLTFSPEGNYLAASMTDGTVRLWDVTEPEHPQRFAALDGIQGTVYGVEFSPDGQHLSATGADHTVHLWNTSIDQARSTICTAARRGIPMTTDEWSRVAGSLLAPSGCG